MAEEIDESGFYRADFSTESDWEVFVHHLGEVFQKWELTTEWGRQFEKNELYHCEWEVQTHTLELLKKEIDVNYYYARLNDDPDLEKCSEFNEKEPSPVHKDLISASNTFGPTTSNKDLHPLARLYGIRRFVVIHPRHLQTQFLTHPAEFSFFLSAAAVVAAEVDSAVPIFVQIYDPKWNFFAGVSVAPTLRTNFDVIALEQAPANSRYLSSLLSIFKDKLTATYLNAARVSVQNTYAMDTIRLRISKSIPFSTSHMPEGDQDSKTTVLKTSQFNALPHGYFPDSCTEVYAVYTWPEIHESIAIDSEMRSDFVPSKAPCGEIHQKVHATSYLSSCLRDYMQLIDSIESLESFVGRNFSGTVNVAEDNPLHHLTQPTHLRHFRPHRQKYVGKTQSPYKKLPGPMNENELKQMLCYLFPDLHPDIAMFPYPKKGVKRTDFDPQRIKSAAPDSLICRLSCLLATCNAHFGGKSGLAQLWAAFTREIRIIWDTCQTIPGVGIGFPDTRTCLLHQKLQMLNVCTERCKSREFGDKQDVAPQPTVRKTTSDDDDDDFNEDEFYDCPNYDEHEENTPEGRLKRLDELKLLDSEEPLYVPVTQEPVPKTEDQLHDDAEVMLKLGPGSGLTTQMMCSSLLSDMEAFKAANPNAKIEDFIRWYSPKDWEETIVENDGENDGVCKLSARMLHPDNTWQKVWKEAKPIPAWRQKRLFDDTNEGLKVLHYLETRNISEIYELTLVPIMHTAVLKIMDILKASNVLDLFSRQTNTLLTNLCRLSRDIEIIGQTEVGPITQSPNPEPVLHQIETLEMQFYQYKCLESMSGYPQCSKLDDVKRQFEELMKNGGNFNIIGKQNYKLGDGDGSESGNMLNPRFKNEMHDNLISKDYVIRLHGETTSSTKGKMGPQFLRAIVTGNKIRLAGAFTENTTFV